MNSFIERLKYHQGSVIYDDPAMTNVYVQIREEPAINIGIAVVYKNIVHCETFSEKCYVHKSGTVRSKTFVSNWSQKNILAISLRIMLESDEPLSSRRRNVLHNSESDISNFNVKLACVKKESYTFLSSIFFRATFSTAVTVEQAIEEVEQLANYFEFLGIPLKFHDIRFYGPQRLSFDFGENQNNPVVGLKYINQSIIESFEHYHAWLLMYNPGKRHHHGFVRALTAKDDVWDTASWLDKAFDWFEGTYRSVGRIEFPNVMHGYKPKEERTYPKEEEPLYLGDIAVLIAEFEKNSPHEILPPTPSIPSILITELKLSNYSKTLQCFHLSRILRNNSHHTLVRYKAHQGVNVPSSVYIALAAYLFNVTWLMLVRRLDIKDIGKSYILSDRLRDLDLETPVLEGLRQFTTTKIKAIDKKNIGSIPKT